MLPKSIRFYCITTFILVIVLGLLRLMFFYIFSDETGYPPVDAVFKAFYLGFKFDLRLAVLSHLPLFLLLVVPWSNPFRNRFGKVLSFAWLSFSFMALMLVYILDFGYFSYLEIRIDASILRFLQNPMMSAQMVWESYSVIGITILLLTVVMIHYFVCRRVYLVLSAGRSATKPLRLRIVATTLVIFLAALAVYGKLSWYPLRWSEAFFSNNDFVSATALNPVLFFARTFKNREIDANEQTAGSAYAAMASYLGVDNPDQVTLNYLRVEGRENRLNERANVVIVILESFAFYKSGLSGNPLNATPFFDHLAKDGVLFTRFYTPHGGTARSVFTAITGLPDVEMNETSTRNPLVIDQHTIINEFSGYDKLYFLGGSASWGQIRGLLARNIEGLKIYEEGNYDSPRVDVWGISDLDLFNETVEVLSQQTQPFFSIIQTAGNHKPYSIPENVKGFSKVTVPREEVVKYGFRSLAALNSYRFMDFSLQVFMQKVSQQPFYDNTLFVFLGDHGLIRSADHMFAAEEKLLLTRGHVPLLFYAPNQLKSAVLDKVASEVDLMPSIAGMILPRYRNTTLGRDLFDPKYDANRYAFTIRHQYGPQIGLIGKDYVFRMRADGTDKNLFSIFSPTSELNMIQQLPEKARQMELLTRDYYETIKYMRYHNGTLGRP